ncbi:uncharacterized protein LOC110464953 [Mizuhopecten yessoensis]|uniref:Peptidase S1 domain-containing protein n=1 Tax=Mizuhopecten yessoensis TaxID=6573 RepID=A0A210PSN0_MIZYE|nr:uncharacterized protein LOC110464953 [Mizuhopecten yessoensis]XP_021376125.1 uncharacterized protein LOC110464953 [Mizuhopecten yessoensis]XP_021376126.1 uncharacterized protein LOC110464953 [Mizuhopecten yessoensis]XP_021376127.1 uncharacterized protein LOC110464953 [Mizuhopecten yessoensis]XP_021376129.1 uncharacterized protein LOC110464953 [Mizuhopecten yessoensis]OWF39500.1 hypothetical protein KP79_PYT11134 [Mizuhopecten yessoensis]
MAPVVIGETSEEIETEREAPSPKSEVNDTPRSRSSIYSSDRETQIKTETDTDTEYGVRQPPKPPGSNIATAIVQEAVGTVEKREGPTQSPDIDCILEIVKKQNIDDFKTLEKRLTTTDRKRILHIVAVYGSADMVECMKTWDGMEWNEECTLPENVFGEALKGIIVSKATALYLATFMNKTEMVSKLINCAGEDNIKYCFKNLELRNPMETVYMRNLAQLLKREHSELEPAIIPGHRVGKDGKRERVFIVYSKEITNASCKKDKSLGLVMKQNPYVYTKESDDYKKDMKISGEDKIRAEKAIARNRDRLWRDHSNLNIIGVSPVIYRNNGADIIQKPCIVLYCSTKGVVPLDEPDFPKQLDIEEDDSIDVDVHEGYFLPGGYSSLPSTSYHDVLKMGCDIGRSTSVGNPPHFLCGTLGPFVKFNNKIGFLTCAHVLFDIDNTTIPLDYKYDGTNEIEVVQPSPDTTTVNGTPQPCGHVKRAIFNPQRNPSIDAAVVELTDRIPNKGQFSNSKRSSYREAGFEELPEYNKGKVQRNLKHFGASYMVFQFGSASDVTRGTVSVCGVDVRPLSTVLSLPLGNGKVQMINQYQVCGAHPTMTFFSRGDSGSAVFMKTPGADDMCCIGMAIGSTHVDTDQFPSAVVTPIGAVLDALDYNIASFP